MNPARPTETARAVVRRAREATGWSEVTELASRVDDLAEAVAENRRLEAPLAEQVTALERSLVPLLELRARRG